MKGLILLLHLFIVLLQNYYGNKRRVKINGSCLKQDKTIHTQGTIVNIYTFYEISTNLCLYQFNIGSCPTLKKNLFGAVSLTNNVDIDAQRHSGYGIGFDRKETFSVDNGLSRICIIFVADMSSSVHVDYKKKDTLVLGDGHK